MANRIFLHTSITGTALCFSFMLIHPGKQPIPENNSLEADSKLLLSGFWIRFTRLNRFNFSQASFPCMG